MNEQVPDPAVGLKKHMAYELPVPAEHGNSEAKASLILWEDGMVSVAGQKFQAHGVTTLEALATLVAEMRRQSEEWRQSSEPKEGSR